MKNNIPWKKIFYWLILIGFVYAISTNLADIENVISILQRAEPVLLILAVVVQMMAVYALSSTLLQGSRLVGIKNNSNRSFFYYLMMLFFNVALPFGAWGGMFIYSKRLSSGSHKSTLGVWVGVMLAQIVVNMVYFLFICAGLLYLDLTGFKGLSILVISAVIFLFLHSLVLLFMWFSAYRPLYLKKFVLGTKEFLGTFGGIRKVSFLQMGTSKINSWLDDFNISTRIIMNGKDSRSLGLVFMKGFVTVSLSVIVLWLLFLSFQIHVDAFQLIVGIGVIYLFTVVSPTPYGIGFVEGAAQLVFSGVGVPKEAAVVIVLAYRGLSVWLPIFLGFFVFRRMGK